MNDGYFSDNPVVDQVNRKDYRLSKRQLDSWLSEFDQMGVNSEMRDELINTKENHENSPNSASTLRIRYNSWQIGMNVYQEDGNTTADIYISAEDQNSELEPENYLIAPETSSLPEESIWGVKGLNLEYDKGEYRLRNLEKDMREIVRKLE